jgi:hypothetical protein
MIKAQGFLTNRNGTHDGLPTGVLMKVNQNLSKNDKNCSNYEKFMPGSGGGHEAAGRGFQARWRGAGGGDVSRPSQSHATSYYGR